MPRFAFLKENTIEAGSMTGHLLANSRVGVPYSNEMIANETADMQAQANPELDSSGLEERYPKAVIGNFDGDTTRLSEMDALVAYLQMLGTLVDFSAYEPEKNER